MITAAANGASSAGSAVLAIVLVILGLAAYFAPTIVAWLRHVPNAGSVTVINVLLGWTLIGWAVALAMACRTRYVATSPYAPVDRWAQKPPADPPGPADLGGYS
jgi:Superinfection immunity protein